MRNCQHKMAVVLGMCLSQATYEQALGWSKLIQLLSIIQTQIDREMRSRLKQAIR